MFDLGFVWLTPLALFTGIVLDWLVGDPEWLPHPVRWIGTPVAWFDRSRSYIPLGDALLGIALGVVYPVLVGGTTFWLLFVSNDIHWILHLMVSSLIVWSCLSARRLGSMVGELYDLLADGGLQDARRILDRLVGRKTDSMDETEVSRAGVETLSEGYLDGVLSPLFWGLIGGPAGMITYRTVNTLDSMIGYRSPKYRTFGAVSARFDDLVNWLPARLTLLFVPVASVFAGTASFRSLQVALADRRSHPSPNAGHPEAAFAGSVGCRLGGKTEYDGYNETKPYLNAGAHPAEVTSLGQSLRLYGVLVVLTELTSLVFLLLL